MRKRLLQDYGFDEIRKNEYMFLEKFGKGNKNAFFIQANVNALTDSISCTTSASREKVDKCLKIDPSLEYKVNSWLRQLEMVIGKWMLFNRPGVLGIDHFILKDVIGKDGLDKNQRWVIGFEEKYLCNRDGHVFRVQKNGLLAPVKGFKHRNRFVFKLSKDGTAKEYAAAKVIWTAFNGDVPAGSLVVRKSGFLDHNNLENLKIETLAEHGKKTGPLATRRAVSLYENGKFANEWNSARAAAKELFISYQAVADICNNITQKKQYDLRWSKNGMQKEYVTEG